jgi:hypothetical protein
MQIDEFLAKLKQKRIEEKRKLKKTDSDDSKATPGSLIEEEGLFKKVDEHFNVLLKLTFRKI